VLIWAFLGLAKGRRLPQEVVLILQDPVGLTRSLGSLVQSRDAGCMLHLGIIEINVGKKGHERRGCR